MDMLTSKEYLERSFHRLQTAHHILTITFPAVQSPKLFLSIAEHLFLAMDYAMNAVLMEEKEKNSLKFNTSFSSRYSNFRLKVAPTKNFTKTQAEQLQYLRNILLEHQKSPMEFERNQSLVICSDDYKMTILSHDSVSDLLRIAQDFVQSAKLSIGPIGQSLSTREHSL
jgi:hypothetical protein